MNIDKKYSTGKIFSVLLIIILAALAFLIMLPGWGYYKDDWHMIWAGHTFGFSGIFNLFTLDRPFMGVLYALSYRFLGESPLAWQLFAFVIRLFSAFAFWWMAGLIWKDRKYMVLMMTAIFLLYPGFLQQPNANTFQNHFIGYTAAILSIGLSIKSLSVKKKSTRIILVLVSMFLTVFYLMIYEYMIGLEAVRFLLLDYSFQKQDPLPIQKRILRLIRWFIPYLFTIALFMFWRFFIFNSTRAATNPGLIGAMYLNQPLDMFLRLFLESLKDLFAVLFSAWFVPLYQLCEALDFRAFFFALLTGLAGMLIWLFFSQKCFEGEIKEEDLLEKKFPDLFLFGILLAFVTLIPILIANRDVHFSNQFDRYTLQATIGVAVAFGALLDSVRSFKLRSWLSAALICLCLITHIGNGFYYGNFWAEQKELWWQLSWRAPGIKKNTTLMAVLPGNYALAEGYEVWGPANRIYYPDAKEIMLSGEALNQETLKSIISREKYGRVFRTFEYLVDFDNSLIFSMPGNGSCMHVLGDDFLGLSENEDAYEHLVSSISKPELIDTDASGVIPVESIFGKEPEHGWCYYYQKICLDYQRQNWEGAAELADEAVSQNLSPADPSELMPLYESYYRLGKMDQVNEIGGVLRASPDFINPYCSRFTPDQIDGFSQDKDYLFLIQNLCPDLLKE